MTRLPVVTLVLLRELGQDLRYALRTLRSQRLFGAVAVLMLALGIGANSAMFALTDAILLRPLPFPDPDRLVMLWEQTPASPRSPVSPINLIDWRARTRTFANMAAFVPNVAGMVMAGTDGTSETVPRQWVSSGIFDVLGVQPVVGRTFVPGDDAERASVVILSESFWRTRFDADPAIVGRTLRLDGEPWVVVGVVPDAARVIGDASMWALSTARFPPVAPAGAGRPAYAQAIGRLAPEVTLEAAAGDLSAVAAAMTRDFPATNTGRSATIEPLREAIIGRELHLTSLLFLGVVGLVLLICCANIASLLLTRATVRRRELAVRAAIGAARGRIVRQLVTESLVLSAAGGLAGVAVGLALLRAAPAFVPPDLLPAPVALAFDARVLAFCALTTLVVGVLFGLAPAWHAAGVPLAQVMAADSRTASPHGGRGRQVLVAAQIATAVVLLVAAGLLVRTLINLDAVDRGYRAERVLTVMVDPLDAQHGGPAGLLRFYDTVEQGIRARPGVRSAGWATTLPLGQSYMGQVSAEVVGDPPLDEGARPLVDYQIVSPSYFETVDLTVVEGRALADSDQADGPLVCLINEAFARRAFPGRSPIGARLALRQAAAPQGTPRIVEIVGVARQVKERPDETAAFLQVYVPLAQNVVGDIFLLVSADGADAGALAPAVRAAFADADTTQLTSLTRVVTLDDVRAEGTGRYRFRAVLTMAFAGLALVLAMAGVLGVLAYSVEQRVRDFGVRRALGATTGELLRVVAGSGIRVVAAGAAIGFALSLAAGRLLATLLFEVRPLDAVTFAVVLVVVTATAALAILAPAWRAARIDPMTALRAE